MRAINVSLDSIVFDNGEFVGPDRGDEYTRLSQQLAAEQHVCDELIKATPLGLTVIRQTLTTLASAQESPRKDLLHWDVYTRRQVRMAEGMLARLDQEGLAGVESRTSEWKAKSAVFLLRKL